MLPLMFVGFASVVLSTAGPLLRVISLPSTLVPLTVCEPCGVSSTSM